MFIRIWLLAVLPFLLIGSAGHVHAEECKLALAAVAPMLPDKDGKPVIQVTIDGKPARMLVDTAAQWSVVASDLKGDEIPYEPSIYVAANGKQSYLAFRPKSLMIDKINFKDTDLFIDYHGMVKEKNTDGVLGFNIIERMDMEIDPANKQVKFFDPDHCPEKVVYWRHSDLAMVPINIDSYGSIIVPASLDGKQIKARISTGLVHSTMSMRTAEKLFDISSETQGLVDVTDSENNEGDSSSDAKTYRYRFESLGLQDLNFHPVSLDIPSDKKISPDQRQWDRENGLMTSDMTIGIQQLKLLHLYFSFREKRLYATSVAGDAAAQSAAPPKP